MRLYDHLLVDQNGGVEEQEEEKDFIKQLNLNSLGVLADCLVEPSLAGADPGSRYQFMRKGYFCVDSDSTSDKLVFNRIVSLRDTWDRILKANKNQKS
ncbi:Glutamine--tRNA ligase [subsurface metagenome]